MKERVIGYLKRFNMIYSAIIIFLGFAGVEIIFNQLTSASDEVFTFCNIFKLHNGINLYSENNVITTPLFFYLGNIFLSLFGTNFFIYKLFGIFIFETVFLLILNLLKKLKIPTIRGVIYIFLFIIPFSKILYINGASYNIIAILFWLVGMNLIIKKDKFEVKVLEQSIVSALVFASKQNIGIYYLMALTIFTIYNYKKDKKQMLKKLFATYFGFALITATWCIALAIQGQFIDFINYCFLGLGEFTYHISASWITLLPYVIPVLAILGLVIVKKVCHISNENKIMKTSYFFFSFMIPSLLIGYPIFNYYHVDLAVLISIVYCMYIAEQFIIRFPEVFSKVIVKVIVIIYMSIILALNIFYICRYILMITSDEYKFNFNDPYYGLSVSDEWETRIKNIVNFVKDKEKDNKDVVIFSADSTIYQLILKGNYQDFDLPFIGNWGYNGEERVLNKIKELKNTYILTKYDDITTQESTKIKDYIKENYEKTGEIEGFDIYYIE